MRRLGLKSVIGIAVAAWAMAGLPSVGWAISALGTVDGNDQTGADSTYSAASTGEAVSADYESGPMVALDLTGMRARVDQATIDLELAQADKRGDDRRIELAEIEIERLRGEAREVADRTVRGAVRNFQMTSFETSLFETVDINRDVRADTLGDAALVGDIETFDVYRDKQKDLDIALAIQELRLERNVGLTSRVESLEASLSTDLVRLGRLEERNLQQGAVQTSINSSTWFQSLGRKQGFYLMLCPVAGEHSFIDSWGFARSGGRRHKGVDILAAIGTPIVAPVNGRVEHYSNTVGGRSFRMWDDHGNYFYGTHLNGFGTQGEVVAGEVIGYVGDDGNAAGIPHLHFEIHAGGKGNHINPFIDTASVCDGAE